MVFVAVGLHAPRYLAYCAVDARVEIAFASEAFEEFAVMSFALSHNGSEYVYALAVVVGPYHFKNLLFGVFHHLLSRSVAVSRTGACEEKPQIVVYLGCRAHR